MQIIVPCYSCCGSGVLECTRCGGSGIDYGIGTCTRCGGSGRIDCDVCDGTGQLITEDESYEDIYPKSEYSNEEFFEDNPTFEYRDEGSDTTYYSKNGYLYECDEEEDDISWKRVQKI